MVLSIDLVLATLDGSNESIEAARYATAIADRYGADLHLLYLFDERYLRGVETGDIPAESIADHQQGLTDSVREQLPATVELSSSSAMGFTSQRLGQTPGTVTLDSADELGADFIVVPRERASGAPENAIGKAALHVIEYASQPVLSV